MTLPSDEPIICFSDLKKLFRRVLPQIKKACLIGASFGFLFFLVKEPHFIATATFKQAASTHTSGFQLRDLFQSIAPQSDQDMGPTSLMMSRAVLGDVVEELGLQVEWDSHFCITNILGRIWENIGLEIGCKLSDVDRFVFQKIHYDQEIEKTLFIKVLDDSSFKLLDEKKNELGRWRLHEPISLPFFSGCLTKVPSHIGRNKIYRLNLLPLSDVIASVRKRFTVKPLKSERSLYTLIFTDRDRHFTADFLNQVMASCRKFIHSENEETASAQLVYLEKRQEELARKWDGSLQEHVAYLKNNLNEGGYLSFAQELEYLQEPQNTFTSRLLDVDFELQRFESQDSKQEESKRKSLQKNPFLDQALPLLHIEPIKNNKRSIFEEQQKEIDQKLIALELEENKMQSLPESGMAHEILTLSRQQEEAAKILEQLENAPPEASLETNPGTHQALSMLNDPKSLVAIWGKQIGSQQKLCSQDKEQLRGYIEQTANKIKILQDNIAVHTSTDHEFAGLTLETAQRLYLDYNNQRDALQAQLKQLVYLSEQLYQPEFELSSITTILADPVTQGLVLQAGETAVRLQDGNNRSSREQDHLKETLRTQKTFIAQHLLQIIELTKLRAKLAEDKIRSLRTTTISLLKQEKQLLHQQLDQISHKMEDLPEKWRRENVLLFKKELGMKMVEGLTHLMESKSIDRHLYHVGSKPLDRALPPVYPKKPYLLMYALIGGFLGAFGSYFFNLSRSLIKGMPVSHETMALSGFNSCGPLSFYCHAPLDQLSHPDLETMRRLAQFLLNQKGTCCAIIGGKHPDFSATLAQLLAMQQYRILVVHYVFDKPVHPSDIPGLWHYLHREVPDCPVRHQSSYDFLPSGGTSRHAVEMLSNPKLKTFLASAKEHYDLILFYSSAQPTDVEGQALLNIADSAIIATKEEKKEDLFPYRNWSAARQKECVAFVDLG